MRFAELFPVVRTPRFRLLENVSARKSVLGEKYRRVRMPRDPNQLRLDFGPGFEMTDSTADARTLASFIIRDCQPFLRQCGGRLMWRGAQTTMNFFRKTIRQDRRPKDSDDALTEILNDTFAGMGFHVNRTNSLFCTGKFSSAKGYGTVYAIFPIGEFHFVWSDEIEDAYGRFGEDESAYKKTFDEDAYDEAMATYRSEYKDWQTNEDEWIEYENTMSAFKQEMEEWQARVEEVEEWQAHPRAEYVLRDPAGNVLDWSANPKKGYISAGDVAREAIAKLEDERPIEPDPPEQERYPEPDEPNREDFEGDYGYNQHDIESTVERSYEEDTDLPRALRSGHEIMVGGTEYYGVRHDFFHTNVRPFLRDYYGGQPTDDDADE